MISVAPVPLRGLVPALVTPFAADDPARIDERALARLVQRAQRRGAAAIVVCGSTGEAPALTTAEHARVVACAADAAAGALPVIAGIGAPCTDAAIALAVAAERCGADMLLASAPPYSKPGQAGLRAHIRAVASATALPVMLYDVPSRAGVAFADDTIARLRDDGAIHAIKDASGDLARPPRLARLCGADLPQFSGDDATALAHLAMGGAGCVSVTANLVPALCAALQQAFAEQDMALAATIRDALAPLDAALFLETNPVPVKAALGLLKLCDPTPRLPLTRAADTTLVRLARVLGDLTPVEETRARAFAAIRPPRLAA